MRRCAQWLLVPAVIATALCLPAAAQMRVNDGNPGGALDANPRVGSLGSNLAGARIINPALGYANIPGNDIVTGHVTGLGYFHGNVPYAGARDFRGNLGSSSVDPFIARSTGSPVFNQGPLLNLQPERFYGNQTVVLPPDVVQRGYTGTYTPPPPSYIPPREYTGLPLDNRQLMPVSGEFAVPGLVDPLTGEPRMVVTSPLLATKAWTPEELAEAQRLLQTNFRAEELLKKRLGLDERTIERMQEELNKSNLEGLPVAPPGTTNQPNTPNVPPQTPLPARNELPPASMSLDLTGKPLADRVRPEGGMFSRLAAGTPLARQSEQYAQLQRRLERFYGVPETAKTDEDRNLALREQLQRLRKAKSEPLGGLPGGIPGEDLRSTIARELLTAPARPGVRPQPLKITSLASGVKAEGLRNLLARAEVLMKDGKFMSALDQYDAAELVSPGNNLVRLGKANAELGAGLYQRAATDLRSALGFDPVLTLAQFDLKAMMGTERLETIVRDLKAIAQKEETDPTPVLLLAYLAYNTGNESQAGVYLDLAQKRASVQDPFIKLLQTHWELPPREANPPTTMPSR